MPISFWARRAMRSVTERFSGMAASMWQVNHALGEVGRDGADVAIGGQHDRRVLRAGLVIGAHEVRHVAGELVARHVGDQQRDRTKPVAQPERPVGGELAAGGSPECP